MTCQAYRSPAPALEADARAVELLETARMQHDISDACLVFDLKILAMRRMWRSLDKPSSEIAELEAMSRWCVTVHDRLLAMADECDKEFAALDENVRDEAEQALGS